MTLHVAKSQQDAAGANASAGGSALRMAEAALDALSARFRPGGLMLLLLRKDGTIAYHDGSAANAFFQGYVVPLMQSRTSTEATETKRRVAQLTPDSGVVAWDLLP